MTLVIQKYGGTSVGSIDRIKYIAQRISDRVHAGEKLIVVVSAMAGQTNELHRLAIQLSSNPTKRELDMLLSVGERISMALLSIALNERRISSLSFTGSQCGILTDSTHGNARISKILGDRLRETLKTKDVCIVAGFQGVDPNTKEITTLGRGGSDLTAVALTAALKANCCEIYTDVSGLYSADPRYVKDACAVNKVSWHHMSELAWLGAKVLHPRAAHLAAKFEIPLYIRSSFSSHEPGTLVEGISSMESASIKTITHRDHLSLIRIETSPNSKVLPEITSWLWNQGETSVITQQTLSNDQRALTVTQTIKSEIFPEFRKFIEGLRPSCKINCIMDDLSCISLVGEGFWQSPETIQQLFECLPASITPVLIEPRNTSISLCVKGDEREKVLQALHDQFIDA